jgi:hypothetical protein
MVARTGRLTPAGNGKIIAAIRMSRQSPDSDIAVTHKFMDFVYDHERPERWTFQDDTWQLPYDYVEFRSKEVGNTDGPLSAFPPLGEYAIKLHMRNSRRKTGETLPFVEVTLKQGRLDIMDNYDRMGEVVKGYHHHEEAFGYAANILVDTLRSLEEAKVMIPAGRRRIVF